VVQRLRAGVSLGRSDVGDVAAAAHDSATGLHLEDGTPAHVGERLRAKHLGRTCSVEHVIRAKALYRRAIAGAGLSAASVARAMGVDSSLVERKQSDKPEHREVPTLPDVLRGPASVRREIARLLDAEDIAPSGMSLERHALTLSRELGDFARALEEAGCTVEPDEASRLDRELVELIERASAARADLRARLGEVR